MEAVGLLAGGIAHDFNNLLTAIIGFSELALDQIPQDGPLRPMISEVSRAGERAAVLTRQLLAFSRQQVLQPEVIDLNEIVSNMERLLTRVIGEDVELATVQASDLGRVFADPSQCEQIIMNLAVNARDAMPNGGKLTIATANVDIAPEASVARELPAGQYVLLAVSDTGTGMDPVTLARVFEPFYTTKEQGKGTGLGLSMVYGIVKQSDGEIRITSQLGQGTAFEIYLPLADGGEVAPKLGPRGDLLPRGTETVLVVEDEPSVRTLASIALRALGYTVLEATQGTEALDVQLQHERPIDLLVADMVMPGMGGREVAQRLGARQPGLKVLFMSGFPTAAAIRQRTLESGTAFLQKPFTPLALARKVRETLDDGLPPRAVRPDTKSADPPVGGASPVRVPAAVRPTAGARLVLCDDHEIARAGLRAMLTNEPDLTIVGEAADGREAVRRCQQLEPDLVLMDRLMPGLDGIAATRAIKAYRPRTSVIIITGDPDPESLFDAIKAGAAGYLSKGVSRHKVITAIRRVLAGDSLIDEGLAAKLLHRLAREQTQEARRVSNALPGQLTPRELEVLQLISQGLTNQKIGAALVINLGTVKAHIEHIIHKLGVSDRTQAAVHAIEHGLLLAGSVQPPANIPAAPVFHGHY
jgi:DNA-binding NarL/FixJ family response regulator